MSSNNKCVEVENKNWSKLKLGELCEVIDSLHKSPKYVDVGYPMIRVKDMEEGYLELKNTAFVTKEVFEEFTKKHKPRKGDILFSRVGSYGITTFVNKNKEFCLGQNTVVITNCKEGIDNKYLYYALVSTNVKEQIEKYVTGSTQKTISMKSIKALEIFIPTIKEQKSIAKVISDIDDKIETNNKINKTLEEMAQAIFKQWFVDFEFPNEEGKPYKSSGGEMVESELGMIPKGWVVTSLNDIVDIFNGYSYKGKELSESKDAMITIKNFDRNGGYKVDGLKEIVISDKVKPHHYVEINDIIVAHTDLTQGAEIIGNPILVHSKGKYDKLIMSMDTVKVKSKIKEINNALLYLILKDYRFKQYALGYVNGTTVLHLSKSTIPQYNIAVPTDKSLMIQLGNCLSSVMSKVANNVKENEKLISIRDTLLPKLMSGEIRVPLD